MWLLYNRLITLNKQELNIIKLIRSYMLDAIIFIRALVNC